MSQKQNNEAPAFDISDIYFVLFRRKWIILLCSLAGICAAGSLFIIKPALYSSSAGIFIQYVKEETGQRTTDNDGSVIKAPDSSGNGTFQTEVEFLNSLDLAQKVVGKLGADKILAAAGGGNNPDAAAGLIMKGLSPDPTPKGSILHVVFTHPDREMAQKILGELVSLYIEKSAEMHQLGISPETLQKLTESEGVQLKQVQAEIRKAQQDAGIISTLEETRKNLDNRLDGIQREIRQAETELAMRYSVLRDATNALTSPASDKGATNATNVLMVEQKVTPEIRNEYMSTLALIEDRKQNLFKQKTIWKEGSGEVRNAQAELDRYVAQQLQLEREYPVLLRVPVATPSASGQQGQGTSSVTYVDLSKEYREATMWQAKTNALRLQLEEVKADLTKVDAAEPNIRDLQRKQEFRAASFAHLLKSSEVSMSDLGGKGGGIKLNDPPTPGYKSRSKKFKKLVMMAAGGGVGAGLVLAFLLEMILDRSVKRAGHIEKKLKLPVFISIPDVSSNGNGGVAQLPGKNRLLLKAANGEALVPFNGGNGANGSEIHTWERNHKLYKFYTGLRERLIVNFEVRNLTHNPKLVAVTSCGRGAGVSSISEGLAASLSQIGAGNVLLVIMDGEDGTARQFRQGKPVFGGVVVPGNGTANGAPAQDHVYVATENGEVNGIPHDAPQNFANMMPQLKGSDYDYIVFDMPPVSQTSTTPRLAGLMDMVLLVIESEKTNHDTVRAATALLTEAKATVSTVLNKTRTYIPVKLHREFQDEA